MKQYKLMILGASTAQLPLIHKAQEMGCYIITVDNIPANVGHQFANQNVDCSTVDRDGVCKIAQQLNIDGIATFASDIATCTVAFVSTTLQLSGCTLTLAETLSNKANFRKFQYQNSLNHPNFLICNDSDKLAHDDLSLQPPLIFKPIDTSGSRGIIKIDSQNKPKYIEAFNYAQSFSRSGFVSIENFVEGEDVSGDGFLIDGQLCAIVSQKYQQGFIPIGHSFPTKISQSDQDLIFKEIANTCKILNYQNGPIDFDVKVSNSTVTIIEMSPRLGGNGIPELIRRSTGLDLIEMTINYALGKYNKPPQIPTHHKHCGSWVFGNKEAGLIEYYLPMEELKKQVPELLECYFNYNIGDEVARFEHSGNSLGYALFDYSSENDYIDMVKRLQLVMDLRVIPTPIIDKNHEYYHLATIK